MMKLQPRDLDLLRNLARYELQSSRELGDQIFAKIAQTTVLRRLRKLEAEHFIQRQSQRWEGEELWSLGAQGVKRIGEVSLPPIQGPLQLHRVRRLSQVRKALEALGLGENWSSAREIRASSGRTSFLPDALFMAEKKGQPISVALLLTGEELSFRALRARLRHFAQMDSLTYLWSLSEPGRASDAVKAAWGTIYRPPRGPGLLISDLDSLLQDPIKHGVSWEAKSDPCRLFELFDLKAPLLLPPPPLVPSNNPSASYDPKRVLKEVSV